MFTHPLASAPECVGRWKERMEVEEDETRGTVCFPRSCQ